MRRGNDGVVGRDALLVESVDLLARFLDALVEAVEGSGLNFENLQLSLLAGEDLAGTAVHGGPIESEANGKKYGENEENRKARDMPGKRRCQPFAEG